VLAAIESKVEEVGAGSGNAATGRLSTIISHYVTLQRPGRQRCDILYEKALMALFDSIQGYAYFAPDCRSILGRDWTAWISQPRLKIYSYIF
jgi:hypothetical protein